MKRELKDFSDAHSKSSKSLSHKAYPDEKGTERIQVILDHRIGTLVTRHIPMKRELKDLLELFPFQGLRILVTRHIPMKRELKVDDVVRFNGTDFSHKAYPDEKGTERGSKMS